MLAWVSMRDPFPVVGDTEHKDMQTLRGKGAYKDYNAHYIPITSRNPEDLYESYYYPSKAEESPHCDEIVVFQKNQAMPRFWLELEVAAPYLIKSFRSFRICRGSHPPPWRQLCTIGR